MRTSTTRLQLSILTLHRCHSEIRNLHILILIQENVFRFQISMTDVEGVTVIETTDDLLKVMRGFGGG